MEENGQLGREFPGESDCTSQQARAFEQGKLCSLGGFFMFSSPVENYSTGEFVPMHQVPCLLSAGKRLGTAALTQRASIRNSNTQPSQTVPKSWSLEHIYSEQCSSARSLAYRDPLQANIHSL